MDPVAQAFSMPEGMTVVAAGTPAAHALPAMLVLPGGGYAHHAEHEAEPVARWLASLGVHAFVLRYRVAPHRHPAPLIDAKRAVQWIRSGTHGLPVDAERVGVLGFSAGGHVAATLSTSVATGDASLDTDTSVPDLAVLCYPVVSFTSAVHQGCVDNLLGVSPSAPSLRDLSAELNVTPTVPPTFAWHTADDAAVDAEHSLGYVSALTRAGVPTELHVFPHGRHGLGLASDDASVRQWTRLCERWLLSRGWISTEAGLVTEATPAAVSAGHRQ
ncbi:alpha/beta hydrolase [Arthrobacter sp. R1-13]